MEYINNPETALHSLTISQAKLAIPAIFGKLFDTYEYERVGHSNINNSVCDIYKITADKGIYTFYEDISAFYGKGNLIPNLWERDLPNPDKLYSLDFCLGGIYEHFKEYGIKRGVDLDLVKIKFKRYSSNMVSNYIAAYYPNRNQIDVTAIKHYDKTYDYPILHSFNLYKLFVLHQVVHILYKHDFENTEIELIGDYYQPKIGIDCTLFTPMQKRTFANEFINYMFWLHKPGAFKRDNELSAFMNSVHFGVQTNLFSLQEVHESIIEAKPDKDTIAALSNEILEYQAENGITNKEPTTKTTLQQSSQKLHHIHLLNVTPEMTSMSLWLTEEKLQEFNKLMESGLTQQEALLKINEKPTKEE